MRNEIKDENDIKKILDEIPIDIFKTEYSNKNNPFEIYKDFIISYQIDFFKLAHEALVKEDYQLDFWQIGNILTYLIPYSKFDTQTIVNFFTLAYNKEQVTSHHFRISQKLSESNRDISKELLDIFLKESDLYLIPHISAILVTLHNKYKESQFNTIINYIESDNDIRRKYGINYLHLYDFTNEEYEILLEKLIEIGKKQVKLYDRDLIYTTSDMLNKGYESFSKLLLLYDIKNISNDLKYDISQVLIYQMESYITTKWYKEIFLSYANIDTEVRIINNIEQILIEYLEKDEYIFIETFLDSWINNSNIYNNELSSFFVEFSENENFSKYITNALNCENYKVHLFISKNSTKTKLNKEVMETFTFDDFLYVCRKILGYFYEFDTQVEMIFSILSVENLSNEVKNLVVEILVNYLGENYSLDTIEYFDKLDEKVLNANEKDVKNIVLKSLNKRNDEWKELPRLKELNPPNHENRIISRVQGIVMSKAMLKSEENSFLSKLFTTIPIKHGRGWFSEFHDNFTEVSYMQNHSHSITVPTATRIHPIHYEFERYNFKLAKKGE